MLKLSFTSDLQLSYISLLPSQEDQQNSEILHLPSFCSCSIMAWQRPPLPPLHRITVVLRTLRRSPWLNHVHRHHTHPQCRQHIRRLFWYIDRLLVYTRRHRLLPTTAAIRQSHSDNHRLQEEDVAHIRLQDMQLRRMHQQQLQESLTRIRHYIRPLHQYLLCHQPGQLTSYHQCMNILHIFTSHL